MNELVDNRRLRAGELVLFVDQKKRQYLVTLADNGEFHTHTGVVAHNDVIDQEEGLRIKSTGRANYIVFRPTLSDYILRMKRGAQVIYPKDLGQILMMADLFHGARVLEAGVGSGALSMTMLRSAPTSLVTKFARTSPTKPSSMSASSSARK